MVNLTLCFRNANMAAYLGDTKMKMLQEFGSIKEKYGAQPASCHNVFQSVCPWDSAGMSAIFMKLMVGPQPHPPAYCWRTMLRMLHTQQRRSTRTEVSRFPATLLKYGARFLFRFSR